jgi:hypothetical protein
MGQSLPQFQGSDAASATTIDHAPAGAAAPARSRRPLMLGAGLLAAGGVAVAVLVGSSGASRSAGVASGSAAAVVAGAGSAGSANAGSGSDAAPADRSPLGRLRAAIAGADPGAQGDAVTALELVGGAASAPLLYDALAGSPDVRVRAARALQRLAPDDAAPKLRAALDNSAPRSRPSSRRACCISATSRARRSSCAGSTTRRCACWPRGPWPGPAMRR